MRTHTFLAAALGVAVFATVVVAGSIAQRVLAQEEPPAEGTEQIDELDCREREGIIYLPPALYPNDGPASTAETPEQALSAFLAERFSRIPEEAFRRRAEATERVQFVVERNAQTKASALATAVEDGWLVETLAVCAGFVA